ncbi:glycosyltransferase family 2 protein [Roseovarius sp. D22-M7]|uniref:glycosyltransferase family 2 protein n=1 Tax=Roseovarius sp. D22-M7 TaxID=3127116 RepID=UPI003010076D
MTVVAVTLCTFRRPEVADTLRSLFAQQLPEGLHLKIIVADNDVAPSGRTAVEAAAAGAPWPVTHIHAPDRNISIARNAGLEAAGEADWIAFLDDDEVAEPDWIARLIGCASRTGADAVFGPAIAEYGPETPAWIRMRDYHSNHPATNAGAVITGHTCNALLRWRGTAWRGARFDPARGRSGGEDTAYFLEVHRHGARFAICQDAIVREAVPAQRLSFRWIARRKYRSGQSFAASAQGSPARLRLATTACGKATLCAAAAVVTVPSKEHRIYWVLRGILHVGVVAGCLNLRQTHVYGSSAP